MTFRKISTTLAAAALAAAAFAAPAAAQVMYGGYNLGPNYGAMIEQEMARGRAMNEEMMRGQQEIIARVMQDPRAAAMYQQHRAQGGQMSPQQFAIWYAGTRGGADTATWNNNESANARAEYDRARGVRTAEGNRAAAMRGYIDGGHGINSEAGNGLSGRGTYVRPDGSGRVMSYMQPGQIQQDAHGNRYVMDNSGQYYMVTPNGLVPMRPRY